MGELAPAAAFRPAIVCEDKIAIVSTHSDCQANEETPKTGSSKRRKNYSWAQLMMRVFELDVLACPRCGGRMRVLCAIHSVDAIQKILGCLGLPTRAPPIAPAKPDEAFFNEMGS